MKHLIPCDNCGSLTAKYDYQLETNKRNFCSRACKEQQQRKYHSEQLQAVLDNFGSVSLVTIAKKIGAAPYGLRQQVTKWRNQGIEIYAPGRGRAIKNV